MRTYSCLSVAGAVVLAGMSQSWAASLSLSANAPSGNFLVAQMSDLGPGTQEGNRNFTDNGGPMGQSFTAPMNGLISRISILSRGNGASGWTTSAQPFVGTEKFGLLFGSVGAGGALQNTTIETYTGLVAPANPTGWLTFDLPTPIAVTAGNTYAFSIAQWAASGMYTSGGWFGFAHSDTDTYSGGTAFNLNSSTANAGDNAGMIGSDSVAKRYGFIDPTLPAPGNVQGFVAPVPGNYDYAFAVQLVPEPSVLALGGIGAVLIALRRRSA